MREAFTLRFAFMLTVLMALDVVFLHNINCYMENKANWFTFTCCKEVFPNPIFSEDSAFVTNFPFPWSHDSLYKTPYISREYSTSKPTFLQSHSNFSTQNYNNWVFLCQSGVCCLYLLHLTTPSISPSYRHSINMKPSLFIPITHKSHGL